MSGACIFGATKVTRACRVHAQDHIERYTGTERYCLVTSRSIKMQDVRQYAYEATRQWPLSLCLPASICTCTARGHSTKHTPAWARMTARACCPPCDGPVHVTGSSIHAYKRQIRYPSSKHAVRPIHALDAVSAVCAPLAFHALLHVLARSRHTNASSAPSL